MKTPKEFDYDLWKTADGRCMVRVKATGETCEVDQATMRFLRAEEKRLRRSMQWSSSGNEKETILSLDYVHTEDSEGMSPAGLKDPHNLENDVLTRLSFDDFRKKLPALQQAFLRECLLGGQNMSLFAQKRGVSRTTLWRMKKEIGERIMSFGDL